MRYSVKLKHMRIAVFIKRTTFHQGYGGLETQNKMLCEGLAKRGYKITVFSPQRELKDTKKSVNNIDYVFIPCVFRTLFSSFIPNHWYNKSYEELKKYQDSKNKKFDLVISQSSAGIGIVKKKDELNIPILVISHGSATTELKTRFQNITSLKSLIKLIPDILYGVYNFFVKQREFILHSNKIIAVSNFVKNSLIEETFVPEERIVVIHNGVDEKRFDFETNISLDKKLLYIGQVHKTKGSDLLTKIFEDTRFKDVTLDVVGGGDYLAELRKEVKRKKLEKNILIHGKFDNYDQVLDFYKKNNFSIFILPTKRYEGFPMSLIEAMFARLPIVAFDRGGVKDAIDNGETGYLVEFNNLNEFKDRILEIVTNRDLQLSMSKKAFKKASKEFTIKIMLDRYEKIIKEMIK